MVSGIGTPVCAEVRVEKGLSEWRRVAICEETYEDVEGKVVEESGGEFVCVEGDGDDVLFCWVG